MLKKIARRCSRATLSCLLFGAMAAPGLAAQVGGSAPELAFDKVWPREDGTTFGSEQIQGRIVVLEFWATWCGPCIPGIQHLNEVQEKLAGEPVTFISVTDEDESRIRAFQERHPIRIWVGFDADRSLFGDFRVPSIPHTVILDRESRIVAETRPEEVTAARLRDLLAGRPVDFAAKETRPADFYWDREQIDWKDGIQPLAHFIIKPISTATGGSFHPAGSNHYAADGVGLRMLIQSAYRTDYFHVDYQLPSDDRQFRISVLVPPGPDDQEERLYAFFRQSLQGAFGFQAEWRDREKDVLVLEVGPSGPPVQSADSDPLFTFGRGSIKARSQDMSRLASVLANMLGQIVVDETGLDGLYDWDLNYQDGNPNMLTDGLKEKLGLTLKPARRPVPILVVR